MVPIFGPPCRLLVVNKVDYCNSILAEISENMRTFADAV